MKKLTTFIMVLAFAIANTFAQKTYVLLTGVSNYGNADLNLSNTTKDVKALQKVFDNQGAKTVLVTSKFATRAKILEKLDAILTVAKEEDMIIFAYSGHGTEGAMATYGADVSPSNMLSYREFVNHLKASKTKKVFCFIDACKAGSVVETSDLYEWSNDGNAGLTFFLACAADEYSYENDWVGHGYFSKALIKGLRGMADTNGDKKVTVFELFKYIHADVKRRSSQTPKLVGPRSQHDTVLTDWDK
jgi:uncharacterized caspase-like protein